MGKPDGAHTHGHGGGGGGLGLNGFADVLSRYVLLPIGLICIAVGFLHWILLAFLGIGTLAVVYGAGFVWGRFVLPVRRARRYGVLPPAPVRTPLPPAYRPEVDGNQAGQLTPGEDLRRAIVRALAGRGQR